MQGYIELSEATDMVDINGTEQTAAEWNGVNDCELVNDTPETYPDLIITWDSADAPAVKVNGNLTSLIGGAHPPQRPR